MILALQYWDGDRTAMMDTARLIADVQPERTKRHFVLFVHRFDAAPPDPETLNYVRQKFDLLPTHRSRRKEIGWPAGCNGVAHDVMMLAMEKRRAGEWMHSDAVWLLESDIVPLKRDWLELVDAEWQEARAAGKIVMGAWSPDHSDFGHVNGNLLFHPELCDRVQGMEGSAPHIGWDVYHAHRLVRHWWKSRQMANYYRATNVGPSNLWPEGEPYSFLHGVKDDSAKRLVRERFGV